MTNDSKRLLISISCEFANRADRVTIRRNYSSGDGAVLFSPDRQACYLFGAAALAELENGMAGNSTILRIRKATTGSCPDVLMIESSDRSKNGRRPQHLSQWWPKEKKNAQLPRLRAGFRLA
jgi:hypothetical protein